jgi:hypothetical protein
MEIHKRELHSSKPKSYNRASKTERIRETGYYLEELRKHPTKILYHHLYVPYT